MVCVYVLAGLMPVLASSVKEALSEISPPIAAPCIANNAVIAKIKESHEAARPLQALLREPWTAKLLRSRRQWGVAFAGIHLAHLGLIFYKTRLVPDFTLAGILNAPAAVVYGLMLAMLVTSFSGPARAVGPKAWKVLHKIGGFVLFFAFLRSQVPQNLDQLQAINAVLLGLAALALAARVAAFIRQQRQ